MSQENEIWEEGETVVKQPTRDTRVNGSLCVNSQLPLLHNLQLKDTIDTFQRLLEDPLHFGARRMNVILNKNGRKSRCGEESHRSESANSFPLNPLNFTLCGRQQREIPLN